MNMNRTPYYSIPLNRNQRFVGRRTELQTLEKKLLINRDCGKMAIVGLGGVGKTQLALQFAYHVKAEYPNHSIFWVPAVSIETFEQGYLDIARLLHISNVSGDKEDVKQLVKQTLSQESAGQWLLILDNLDDMDIVFGSRDKGLAGITNYLPASTKGSIAFTTRYQEIAVNLVCNDIIELEKMNVKDAVDYLTKSLVRKNMLNDRPAVLDLLTELIFLPLAITQAAAYLNIRKISIGEYLRLLNNTEEDRISLLSRDFRDETRYESSANPVLRTWLTSFNHMWTHHPEAAEYLFFMSCIEPKAIPKSILPVMEPEERMTHAIGILSSYSFITESDGQKTYDIHRLIHLATRNWLREQGSIGEQTEKAIQHLEKVFPTDEYTNRPIWNAYLPHAIKVLSLSEGRHMRKRYELCDKVGCCLEADGRAADAVKWLSLSYGWKKDTLGVDDTATLSTSHNLAISYSSNGQISESIELLEHVVNIEEKALPENHPGRLTSQHTLALTYLNNSQISQAIELLEHVVNIQEKTLAENHPHRLASQQVLASAYRADGQISKAIELLESVVNIQEKTLAENHPDRLASQHTLAITYLDNSQISQAIELLEHVVNIREKTLAENHPHRLTSQRTLAIAYQADGQISKAIELLESVVNIQEKALAENHPHRLASQHALAGAYHADGQIPRSIGLLKHVVKIEREVLPEGHQFRKASEDTLKYYQKLETRRN
jgi:tetratricopeptide (TPR) repeat protein